MGKSSVPKLLYEVAPLLPIFFALHFLPWTASGIHVKTGWAGQALAGGSRPGWKV